MYYWHSRGEIGPDRALCTKSEGTEKVTNMMVLVASLDTLLMYSGGALPSILQLYMSSAYSGVPT